MPEPVRPHAKANFTTTLCHQDKLAREMLRSGVASTEKDVAWVVTHASDADLLESRSFRGYAVTLDYVPLRLPWYRDEVLEESDLGYSVLTIVDPARAAVVIPFRDIDAATVDFGELWIPKRRYRTFTPMGVRRGMNEVGKAGEKAHLKDVGTGYGTLNSTLLPAYLPR